MNAIVQHTASSPLSYGDLERLAASIAQSGLFGIKTKDQAIAMMMIAHAEGRHPALAARDYDIIQGRPAKKAEAMLRDFFEAGGRVEWHALTDQMADATFSHPRGGTARISWDMARATQAQLSGKDMFKKFPRQMLRSRTVSEGVRTVWPLATSGMYVPEELRDMPEKEEYAGPTIEATSAREAINAAVPMRAAAAATPRAPSVAAKERTDDQWRLWLDKLRAACTVLRSRDEVVEVGSKSTVGDALATGPAFVQREISAILAESYARFPEADAEPEDDFPGDLPDLEIAGAEKMASG
jgi:hypothetical protein